MNKSARARGPLMLIGTVGGAAIVLLGAFAFVLWDQMLVHYHVGRMVQSEEASESARWLHERHHLALPAVLPKLSQEDATVCQRCGSFLQEVLAEHHDPTDPEDSHLCLLMATMLHEQYRNYSVSGCMVAVDLAFEILEQQLSKWSPNVPTALESAGELVLTGLSDMNPAIRQHTLTRLREIWTWNGVDDVSWSLVNEWKRECYMQAVRELHDKSAEVKKAAVNAIVQAPFHEGDAEIVELLAEQEPELRRAALLALARASMEGRESTADSLMASQKMKLLLIDFLHDPDEAVQDAARRMLLRSGVSNAEIHLAKMIKDPQPAERAKVPALAFSVPDIDPVVWVMELADDPSAAVRIAVARAAANSNRLELRAQLAQMANSDPDPTVRQMSQELLANRNDDNIKR